MLAEAREARCGRSPWLPDPGRRGHRPTASHSASRLLEIATRDAEALVVEARDEADQSLAQARAEAAEIIQTALSKVHAREEALDAMVAEQRDELDRMRTETLRELEGRRAELNDAGDQLTEYEEPIRTHLVSYFSEQLETLGRADRCGHARRPTPRSTRRPAEPGSGGRGFRDRA